MENSGMFQSKLIPIILCVLFLITWNILRCKEEKWKVREIVGLYLFNSPIIRTILFVFTVVLSGIQCSAFIAELNTSQGVIEWSTFYEKLSFYWLLFIVIVDFIYNWFTNSTETEIMKFSDEGWFYSYVRSKTVGTYIEKVKEGIKSGDLKVVDVDKLFKFK